MAENSDSPERGEYELRPFETQDAQELFALVERNQAELAEWLVWAQRPTEQAMYARIEQLRLDEAERRCVVRAILVEDKIVGEARLADIDWTHRCAAIGYWLGSDHQGRGLVTKAVAALVRYGFDTLELNRIEIHVSVTNVASRAVAERLGFRFEGTLRQAYRVHADLYNDDALYAMLAADPERDRLP